VTRIDAHQHFWDLERGSYPWLTPTHGPIYRSFGPADLEPLLAAAGIDRTVLVQAADSYADTEAMLAHADAHEWIAAVVGWVPLERPDEAAAALDRFGGHPRFCGVRHLLHDELDPDWVVRPAVLESLALLEERGLVFEIPAVFPDHLVHVPALAARFPRLRIVVDHLGKPPIRDRILQPWAEQLAAASAFPNVYAKVSGLNTVAAPGWSAEDLAPYVDHALACFGAGRLCFGSDWPVCLLADDYARVVGETERALPPERREPVLGGTASELYRL
jgi:L-fuconolactonase